MATNPLFLSEEESRGQLIQVGTALESMRDAGYDLTAAAGEPLDNSIEANATVLRVKPVYAEDRKSIRELVFADNGVGIDPKILHHVLSMGYSTRYGQRKGLGRFGVGLKLAGLSLGERIEIYTRPVGDTRIYYSYFDLQEIRKGQQKYTTTLIADDWPEAAKPLMQGLDGDEAGDLGGEFATGTVVVFGKIDRLGGGRKYGTALSEKMADLRKFIARAYRKFLDTGRIVELEGKRITLHDPLFLMDNPRIIERYRQHKRDPRGILVETDELKVDGHAVTVTVTIVPPEFRPKAGDGGQHDYLGNDIREFQINEENTGKISILRNGREIYYDIVPKLIAGGRSDKVNRYIGVEVSFPAELDEYFQVRHVKRGAEPVNKLREELRNWLIRPMKAARQSVRAHWRYLEQQQHVEHGEYKGIMDSVEAADARIYPQGIAGRGISESEQKRIIRQVIEDLNLDPEAAGYEEATDQLVKDMEQRPVTVTDGGWPGKEFLEISHLNTSTVLKLNKRHVFFSGVYADLAKVVKDGADGLAPEDVIDLASKACDAMNLLLASYARAEGMQADVERFDSLKSQWGIFLDAYIKERFREW
ncbi:ATP-binding protein [Streptomyces griseus]|uniref:ATP-binding protein n=1 Tax=Streptomyces griseus TaxID=1911 RepID=UPI0036A5BBEC